ncbi:protein of unknown function [Magnetospirillum sp. XM-1]|nr:protein of unknown function [Magnetospirillum sp. XM-1]
MLKKTSHRWYARTTPTSRVRVLKYALQYQFLKTAEMSRILSDTGQNAGV